MVISKPLCEIFFQNAPCVEKNYNDLFICCHSKVMQRYVNDNTNNIIRRKCDWSGFILLRETYETGKSQGNNFKCKITVKSQGKVQNVLQNLRNANNCRYSHAPWLWCHIEIKLRPEKQLFKQKKILKKYTNLGKKKLNY